MTKINLNCLIAPVQTFLSNALSKAHEAGIPLSRSDLINGIKNAFGKVNYFIDAFRTGPHPYIPLSTIDEDEIFALVETAQQKAPRLETEESLPDTETLEAKKQEILLNQQTQLIKDVIFNEEFARTVILQDETKERTALQEQASAQSKKTSHKKIKPKKMTLADFLSSDTTPTKSSESNIEVRRAELEKLIDKLTTTKETNAQSVKQEIHTWADHVRGHAETWASHVKPKITMPNEPIDVKKFPELGTVTSEKSAKSSSHHKPKKGTRERGYTPDWKPGLPSEQKTTASSTVVTQEHIDTKEKYDTLKKSIQDSQHKAPESWADRVRGFGYDTRSQKTATTTSETSDKNLPTLGEESPPQPKERIVGAGRHSSHSRHRGKRTTHRLFEETTKPVTPTQAPTPATEHISTREQYLHVMAASNPEVATRRFLNDQKRELDILREQFLKEYQELDTYSKEMYIHPKVVKALSDVQNQLRQLLEIEMKEMDLLRDKGKGMDSHALLTTVHNINAISFMLQKLIDNPKMTPEQVKIISDGLLIDTKFMHLEHQKTSKDLVHFKKDLEIIDKHIEDNNKIISQLAHAHSFHDKATYHATKCMNTFLKLIKNVLETISYWINPKPTEQLAQKFKKFQEEIKETSPQEDASKPKIK